MPSRYKYNRTLRASLVAAVAFLAAAPANACYTVHFDNKSQKDIYAVWSAAGCAGLSHWIKVACEQKIIKAGGSASYNYKWGTTRPLVTAFQKLNLRDEPESLVKYALHHGKFKLINDNGVHLESASKCGNSYTITFSEADRVNHME
ncbi:MAG: hypothetical protein AAFX54_03120 [Pseudomonadota bacterium]